MPDLHGALREIRHLDELAGADSYVHRLDPAVKLLTTLIFTVVVASYGRYALAAMLPLAAYPLALFALAELPARPILKRLILAAPFAFFLGILNPLFERTVAFRMGGFALSGGWLSFLVIMAKCVLCVGAVLILIATTGFFGICGALGRLRVPRFFVAQLALVYRYFFVLGEEAERMVRAHALRAGGKSLTVGAWGSLAGGLLLRAMARAERIYQAMLCRGFSGGLPAARSGRIGPADLAFLSGWTGFFLLARAANLPVVLGRWILEVMP